MPNVETATAADPYVELAADIVSAYVSNNSLRPSEVIELLKDLVVALKPEAAKEEAVTTQAASKADIRKSLGEEYLVSFEDGKRYKSLKRHLSTHGLTPEQYRSKWGLPVDYPMVAPSYAARRSELAKKLGLGRKGVAARGSGRKS